MIDPTVDDLQHYMRVTSRLRRERDEERDRVAVLEKTRDDLMEDLARQARQMHELKQVITQLREEHTSMWNTIQYVARYRDKPMNGHTAAAVISYAVNELLLFERRRAKGRV